MTRLQKKCLVFSVGLHGLLTVILFASAGFSSSPPPQDLQIMTLIPANIVDRAGSGGGTPVVNLIQQPKPQAQAPTQPQPTPPPQPAPEPAKPAPAERVKVERVPTPAPPQPKETKRTLPESDETKEVTMDSKPRPSKPKHEIHVSYTLASVNSTTTRKKPEKSTSTESSVSARSEARRLKEIENSLSELASGVRTSASPNTIVDTEGIGGGAAFAGYRDVVFNVYYHAWKTPEDSANRQATADAKVVIARDGSVISAELIRSSDDQTLDRSVERVLRAVTKLPPFPASTRDEQRTFVIRFSPDKEMNG
jgi:TonB family protein